MDCLSEFRRAGIHRAMAREPRAPDDLVIAVQRMVEGPEKDVALQLRVPGPLRKQDVGLAAVGLVVAGALFALLLCRLAETALQPRFEASHMAAQLLDGVPEQAVAVGGKHGAVGAEARAD